MGKNIFFGFHNYSQEHLPTLWQEFASLSFLLLCCCVFDMNNTFKFLWITMDYSKQVTGLSPETHYCGVRMFGNWSPYRETGIVCIITVIKSANA
jgi:hypothetical protein